MSIMRYIFPIIGILFTTCNLVSCRFSAAKAPNFIIIAAESLGFDEINCLRDRRTATIHSGFDLLCDNSVRFTHAFTPSILAVPALSSIMTGLNPVAHGVRNNGKNGLSASFQTLAENLNEKGYVTSFFSGGPPVLRKTLLHQGFDLFDDNLPAGKFFRSFDKAFSLFFSWLDENKYLPFFTVFYVPDLLYEETQATTELGEERPQSFESQLESLDEKLFNFLNGLQSRKLWDNTYVILVGLNGRPLALRPPKDLNLDILSDRSQIAMLIKPINKPRDLGLNWSIDRNVSTTDLTSTINEIAGLPTIPQANDLFSAQTLAPLLLNPGSAYNGTRWIYTESGWADWQGIGNIRVAVRQDHLVYLHDQRPTLFNSLTDRFETNPIQINEKNEFVWRVREQLKKMTLEPFRLSRKDLPEPTFVSEKLKKCYDLFHKKEVSSIEKRKCEDRLTIELYDWFINLRTQPEESITEEAKKKFLRNYAVFLADKKTAERNEILGRVWDIPNHFYLEKSVTEEILKGLQNVITPSQKGTSDASATKH